MKRARVSATVDAERLARARERTGARDSQLLDQALEALLEKLEADRERAALLAAPYEQDPDLAWVAPVAPNLPYEGEIPAEVLALAAARRRR